MRPRRLEMAGFSAFAEPTVVDFDDVELCAFVGATGAGKSSVIDAMTFALYGAVARYDQRTVAPVINQLATEAKVRFDFELAGTAYSAVRVVRRTKNGATTKEARLESGDAVLAGDEKTLSTAIVGLLGLDFDKFNKTVVLPQGRFAEFLHDKPADRQELLRGLFGVGIYDRVGKAARERAARAKNGADLLDDQVAAAGDVSDERLAALVGRAEAIEAVLAAVETIGAEIDELERRAAALGEQLASATTRRDALARVVVPAGVAALDAELQAAAAAAATAAAEQAATRARFDAASAATAMGPSQAEMQLLLAAHDALAGAQRDLASGLARVADAEEAHGVAVAAASSVRQRRAAAVEAIAEAEQASVDAARAVRDAGDLAEVRRLLDIHTRRDGLAGELGTVALEAASAEAVHSRATERAVAARQAVAEAERLAPAAMLAGHLVVGEACPVCAQVVGALPVSQGDAVAHLSAAHALEHAATGAADAAARSHRSADSRLTAVRARLDQLDEQLAGQPASAVLEELAGRLVALAAAAEEARAAADEARRAVASVTGDELLDAEAEATTELASARALRDRAAASVGQAAAAVARRPDRVAAEQALEEARRLAAGRDEAEGVARRATDAAGTADAALAAVRRREQQARREYDDERERLSALVPAGLPARQDQLVADWRSLAQWAGTEHSTVAAQVETSDRDHRALVSSGAVRRGELAAVLAAAPGAPARVLDVAGERRRLTGGLVDARAAIATLEHERERVAAAQAQAVAWRQRAAVATMLGNLLRTDQFERWLLDEALTDLVERANVRLGQLTAGHYSLATAEGSFRVVDHRNADEMRDARSLSGGETFLTSLALALALADSSVDAAAQGGEPIESIFLDEGFGTLDPDTLDVVAGTIEELGSGGRLVGIITHIRELADRMPTRFEVASTSRGTAITRVDV